MNDSLKIMAVVMFVCLSALLVSAALVAAPADPYAPSVSLTLTLPDGKVQRVDLHEGETTLVKLDNGVEYKFRPTILDARPWTRIVVAIFKAATASAPDETLGEVALKTGAPAVTSKTTPAFKIAAIKVTASSLPIPPPNPFKIPRRSAAQ